MWAMIAFWPYPGGHVSDFLFRKVVLVTGLSHVLAIVARSSLSLAIGVLVLRVGLAAFWPVINAYLIALFQIKNRG